MTIWLLTLWFIPFGATMDTPIAVVPVYQRPAPEFSSQAACEQAKGLLLPQLTLLVPDPQANLESIEVRCLPKQVPS